MVGNEILNQIQTIRDLKMVKIYPLFEGETPLMGLMVYYADKTMNYCSADRYFPALLDRIAKVYEEEYGSGEIITDDQTKRILGEANDFCREDLMARLPEYEENDAPKFLPKGFTYVYVMPIVTYVMKAMYDRKDGKIQFDDFVQQWFEKGILSGVIDDRRQRYPYRISLTAGDVYDVTVCNVLKPGNVLKVNVSFGMNGIAATYYDQYYCYQGTLRIDVRGDKMTFSHVMKDQDQTAIEIHQELEEAPWGAPTECVRRLTAGENAEWKASMIPWGGYVYKAVADGKTYLVYSNDGLGITISRGVCVKKLSIQGGEDTLFGQFAFRFYEREDATELRFLDMEYPRSARYAAEYADRCYIRKLEYAGE